MDVPETIAGMPKPEWRLRPFFFASWVALLLGVSGFALWLSLSGCTTKVAPPTAAGEIPPTLKVGAVAPDFVLRDQEGKSHRLQESLKQGPVLLVFYLNLSCGHCVAQLQAVGDAKERLSRRQVSIFGISADSPEFTKGELKDMGGLPYPLLADQDHRVAEGYGVYAQGDNAVTLHGVFLIGQDRRVRFMETGPTAYMDVQEIEYQAAKAGTPPSKP